MNRQSKKRREERRDKFNKKFDEFSKDKPVKCLSDKGLLYLRYGIDKLRNFYGKDYLNEQILEREQEDKEIFEDYCIRIYNEFIRGNMEFTNKSMISNASAMLYICCVMKGINITQKDISEIYGVSEVRIRNNYTLMRKAMKV